MPDDAATLRDRRLLIVAGGVRCLGVGMTGPLLGVHLAALQTTDDALGLLVGVGLAGCAGAALAVTLRGDRWGRRRTAAVLCALTGIGGIAVAALCGLMQSAWQPLLLLIAGLAMLNGMGKDRGAVPVLESAMLPNTTDDRGRTGVIAQATAVQDLAQGFGALCVSVPALLVFWLGLSQSQASGATLGLASVAALAAMPLYLALSPRVEASAQPPQAQPPRPAVLSPQGRRTIARLSALFSLDAIGGGFLTSAGMAYIFSAHFQAEAWQIGLLFAAARGLNALSHLAAARLAARIGLINTMVFTHIPSSLLLITVAFTPSFPIAAALFLLREGLVEMDVPTRQSYVVAVVAAQERTAAAGITALVRMAGWSLGACCAAPLTALCGPTTPLLAGAGLKLIYDGALWAAFRGVKPPEERGTALR